MRKLKIAFISLVIVLFSMGAGGSLFLMYISYKDLPDVSKLVEDYDPVTPTIIFDSKGKIIDRIYTENREIVDIDDVPVHLRNAVLAIEDRRFMEHFGFDYIRFVKSVITAPIYFARGRHVHGGSTITQQLSRNAFLTHERKITRKIKELIIAIEIERRYTKEEILEKYLNEIYFGSGAYGIQTASKTFYGKSVSELNAAESALLVGVPNRPGSYSPMINLENAVKRKNIVLMQMHRFGFLSDTEYEESKKQLFIYEDELSEEQKLNPYVTVVKRKSTMKRGIIAPEFVDIVRKEIEDNFDEKLVYEGGLRIYTTIDLDMQREAEEALRNSKLFEEDSKLNGALVTIDSSTGHVRAMVGGREYKSGDFNRATMSVRQPGSAFKPFIYFTALDMGYPMNMILEDSPINMGGWKPNNYGGVFRNNITMIESIERSININAIKLLHREGLDNLASRARKAGITTEIPNNLTTALGTMSITPLELATSYAPFSNGGYKIKPIFISRVEDKYGKVMLENRIQKSKVFNTESTAKLNFMMQDVVKYGSGKNSRVTYKDEYNKNVRLAQAGKTGTTNEWRSAWFSGYTPDLITSIYVGYDDNSPTKGKLTGGGAVAHIWGDFYQRILNKNIYTPSKSFDFLDDLIKDKSLIKIVVDSRNGLRKDDTSYITREVLLDRGRLPVEKAGKYRNGIRDFFDKKESDLDMDEENLTNSEEEDDIEVERNKEIDNILNNLFND
jgi:penicillin-binding protein 1A